MEKLIQILKDIDEDIEWDEEQDLVDDRILTSLMIITIIAELEDEFDIEINAAEIVPENFNSAEAMWNMICSLQE